MSDTIDTIFSFVPKLLETKGLPDVARLLRISSQGLGKEYVFENTS